MQIGDAYDYFGEIWLVDQIRKGKRPGAVLRHESRDAFGKVVADRFQSLEGSYIRSDAAMRGMGYRRDERFDQRPSKTLARRSR